MTGPTDDWQKRIEAGLPFHPTADELTAGYPTPDTPNPPGEYPGGAPSAEFPNTGHPAAPGPVFGAPGSGPGYPPPGFASPATTQQFAAVPGYGYMAADAAAPFGRDPVTGEPLSDKSKVAAGLLQMLLPFLSICGVGRLYIGSTAIGLIQLLGMFVALFMSLVLIGIPFVIGFWLWTFIDGIMILAGNVRDGQGRKLRN
ncbi:TM2 domain-containing protein [Rhodococcus sp. NPDC003322]